MDNVIKDLVALDKKAREMVKNAEDEKNACRAEIAKDKEAVLQHYQQRKQKKMEQIEQETKQKASAQISEMEKTYEAMGKQLKATFEANRENWVAEMVKRCLS